MADRVYSKEEADAILARAIELQGHGEATSHADLIATAREIGIAPEALERAAGDVLARRRDDHAFRALRARQWRGFYAHLVPFVCAAILLGFINVVTGGFPWAVIPILAWAIGLASHLLAVAMPDQEKLRRRAARATGRQREGGHAAAARVGSQAGGRDARGARMRVAAEGDGGSASDERAAHARSEAEAEAESERSIERRPQGR